MARGPSTGASRTSSHPKKAPASTKLPSRTAPSKGTNKRSTPRKQATVASPARKASTAPQRPRPVKEDVGSSRGRSGGSSKRSSGRRGGP